MPTRTDILERRPDRTRSSKQVRSLTEALPKPSITSAHHRIVAAAPEAVWDAFQETTWGELRFTKPFMIIRSAGTVEMDHVRLVDRRGPGRVIFQDEPYYAASGMIGRPWTPAPTAHHEVTSLQELRDFDQPGWLKYGMEFRLTPLPDSRTLLETQTRCQPTDERAAHRFRTYWTVIGIPSGLIRRDMLRAIAARAEGSRR